MHSSDLPIDWDHLRRYTHGERDIECEILELYRTETDRLLTQLSRLAEASPMDGAEWYRVCHSLKGSSRGIGAFEMGDLAETAEHFAGTVSRAKAQSLVRALRSEMDRVTEAIAQHATGERPSVIV